MAGPCSGRGEGGVGAWWVVWRERQQSVLSESQVSYLNNRELDGGSAAHGDGEIHLFSSK